MMPPLSSLKRTATATRRGTAPSGTPPAWQQLLRAKWQGLQPRERLLVGGGLGLLALALLWLLAMAPALQVLRTAPPRIDQLQRQLQQMQSQAAEAALLREQNTVRPSDVRAAVTSTSQAVLGARAVISSSGDQLTLKIEQAPGDELMSWLSQLRSNARLTPIDTDLQADAHGLWRGSVSFTLPPSAN